MVAERIDMGKVPDFVKFSATLKSVADTQVQLIAMMKKQECDISYLQKKRIAGDWNTSIEKINLAVGIMLDDVKGKIEEARNITDSEKNLIKPITGNGWKTVTKRGWKGNKENHPVNIGFKNQNIGKYVQKKNRFGNTGKDGVNNHEASIGKYVQKDGFKNQNIGKYVQKDGFKNQTKNGFGVLCVESSERVAVCQVGTFYRGNHWADLGYGEMTVDPAAEESCWPKGYGDAYETKPSSKNIVQKTANGDTMKHYGEKDITFLDKGDICAAKFQVTDVRKPLMSVRRMVEKGNIVQFGPEVANNFIINVKTGKRIQMERKGNSFIVKANYVKKVGNPEVFPWQAGLVRPNFMP